MRSQESVNKSPGFYKAGDKDRMDPMTREEPSIGSDLVAISALIMKTMYGAIGTTKDVI